MPFSGSGTGIQNADDIFFSSVSDGETLVYNSGTAKWGNAKPTLPDGKAVVSYNVGTGVYPARPTGFASVEWVGPVDPGTSAQENDTWLDTSEV